MWWLSGQVQRDVGAGEIDASAGVVKSRVNPRRASLKDKPMREEIAVSRFSNLSRRHLLTGGSAALAGAVLRPASAGELRALFDTPQRVIEQLRLILGEGLYLPADDGFGLKAQVNNLRYIADLPHAIAVCPSPAIAANVVDWCRDNQVAFRIKGGGHSYAGFSAGPVLIIYTQGMDSISVPAPGLVTVGAGAINYMLYDQLEALGRTMTHGRCPMVGAAGFVLGGGIGFDMRRFGMACDMLQETSIILADGRDVRASADEHPDLFWALRGGAGGNFGLSTSFTFRTEDVSSTDLTVFERTWRSDDQALMARFLFEMMTLFQADETGLLGTRISVQYTQPANDPEAPNGFALNLVGQWAGEPRVIDDLLRALSVILKPEPGDVYFTGPYWAAQHLLEEADETFFYQERSTFAATTPSDTVLYAALDHLRARPPVHGPCDMRFFQTGGAVNATAPDATAFVHRDSQWLPLVGFYWTARDQADPALIAQGHVWQDRFYAFMLAEFPGKGAFQNFPDVSLTDWQQAYYGDNLDRLRQVKAAYDPGFLFDFPQAIPPA